MANQNHHVNEAKNPSSVKSESLISQVEGLATPRQKQLMREHGGNGTPEPDCFDYVEGALDEVKRLISWLEYVAENEYTATEREKLITSAKRFATIAQPIASKYID